MSQDTEIFLNSAIYANQDAWHEAAQRIRGQNALPLVTSEDFNPFYAVTRHADIQAVERKPVLFANTLAAVLEPKGSFESRQASGTAIKTLIHMDGDENKAFC